MDFNSRQAWGTEWQRSFPIVLFDSSGVIQLLYSCAYARAAAMDALVVDEPTVLNSLFKYAPAPKRIGSLTEGDPMAFRRAIPMIFLRYQSGYNSALGTGGALLSQKLHQRAQ